MKNKEDILRALAQTAEDRLLLAQVLDKLETSRTRSYVTHTKFLDLHERSLAQDAWRMAGAAEQAAFAGGYEGAERAVAVFFPDYLTQTDATYGESAPICALRAEKSAADALTHRDYLGALMGLGLRRDSLGDILVREDGADFIVLAEVKDFLLLEFSKAGRKRLSLSEIPLSALQVSMPAEEVREGNVASPRLDSVAALAFGISRTEAQSAISRGLVFHNDMQCSKGEREISVGDRITMRGKGRARILEFTGTSKKGRLFLRFSRSK